MEKVNKSLAGSCYGAVLKEGQLFREKVTSRELAEWASRLS